MTVRNGTAPILYLPFGDSKTNSWTHKVMGYDAEKAGTRGCYPVGKFGHPGDTIVQLAADLVTDLAGYAGIAPTVVLFNAGVNDPVTEQAIFQTNYAFCLDTLHTAWPTVLVYCAQVYAKNHITECDRIDDLWIPPLVAARSAWCRMGINERDFLTNDDYRLLDDPIHLSNLGYTSGWNDHWRAVLGV